MTRALGRAAGMLCVVLALAAGACKGRAAGEECVAFGRFPDESTVRANGSVPDAERNAAHTASEIGAWHRKLARAYDVEAAAPPRFESPKVKDYEAHYKRTYALTASALRKMADGLERGDRAGYRAGSDEETAAGRERQRIVDDWTRHCTE
jgi:hypothetical protein